MTSITKINPDNIKQLDISELDVEWRSLKSQEKILERDPERMQKINHADRDMDMKESWSQILGIYLAIFTILMFATLWFNGKWCLGYLEPTTLNFLITVGFVKVIGVVWVIVSHLFPSRK